MRLRLSWARDGMPAWAAAVRVTVLVALVVIGLATR